MNRHSMPLGQRPVHTGCWAPTYFSLCVTVCPCVSLSCSPCPSEHTPRGQSIWRCIEFPRHGFQSCEAGPGGTTAKRWPAGPALQWGDRP